MFSRKAKYALQACIALARQSGDDSGSMLIADIAEQEQLPRKFLEVILLDLRHAGILKSKKGRGGGYRFARSPEQISVADVLRAIDGPPIPYRCVVIRSDKTCEECRSAGLCPIGPLLRHAADHLMEVLRAKSLSELAQEADRLQRDHPSPAQMFHI